jgi:DNA repair protein RadD
MRKNDPTSPFPIQPQREWEEAKRRLNEEAKRLAKLLLNHAEVGVHGRELINYGLGNGKNNFVCALMLVNKKFNEELGKDGDQASIDEFRAILDTLEGLLRGLVRRVRKAKSDYEQATS